MGKFDDCFRELVSRDKERQEELTALYDRMNEIETQRLTDKLSIAGQLKKIGFPVPGIAKGLGLSIDQVEKL